MQGSKYDPATSKGYSSKDLNANFQGVKFTATKGEETAHDFLITDDHLVDGAVFLVQGAVIGDHAKLQVVDKDNVLGLGSNTVLGQFISNWYINPDNTDQGEFKSVYPAKVLAGLYIRITYTSTSGGLLSTNPVVIVNFKLHKVLW